MVASKLIPYSHSCLYFIILYSYVLLCIQHVSFSVVSGFLCLVAINELPHVYGRWIWCSMHYWHIYEISTFTCPSIYFWYFRHKSVLHDMHIVNMNLFVFHVNFVTCVYCLNTSIKSLVNTWGDSFGDLSHLGWRGRYFCRFFCYFLIMSCMYIYSS